MLPGMTAAFCNNSIKFMLKLEQCQQHFPVRVDVLKKSGSVTDGRLNWGYVTNCTAVLCFLLLKNNVLPPPDHIQMYRCVLWAPISIIFFLSLGTYWQPSPRLQLEPALSSRFSSGQHPPPSYWSAVQHQHAGVSIREPLLPICESRAETHL